MKIEDAYAERVRERAEREQAVASRSPVDAISLAVGSGSFVARHRFADLKPAGLATAGALVVSRYYFAVSPPVVVDIGVRESAEVVEKRSYCRSRGIRYVIAADAFDDESVRDQLTPVAVATPGGRKPPVAQKRAKTRVAK